MGESKIIRKGGGGKQTAAPTITLISKDDSSITVTFTNNDSLPATILYEPSDSTPDENSIELASGATSVNITFSGLSSGTQYLIYANSNAVGKVQSETIFLSVTTDVIPVLGVQWDSSNSSPTLTRTDDAVGLTVSTANGYKTSDYDAFAPYSGIKRCNLADNGTVNAYYGDAGYTENGSNGQVMVEIPKFYYKVDKSGTTWNWRISQAQLTGYKVHPAFVTNGVEKAFIYFSAFEGNGTTMQSIAGVTPDVSQTIATFRGYAQARGTGWEQQRATHTFAVQLLYLIEYANFNSQAVLGQGITSDSAKHNTGETSANAVIAQSYGYTSDGTHAMSYRGIENFFGNIWKFIDGLMVNNSGFYYDDNAFNDTHSGYNLAPFTTILADGYVSDLLYDTNLDFSLGLGIATSGSATTYLCDYNYVHDNGEENIALFGGNWTHGSIAGAFLWFLGDDASFAFASLGARLSYM